MFSVGGVVPTCLRIISRVSAIHTDSVDLAHDPAGPGRPRGEIDRWSWFGVAGLTATPRVRAVMLAAGAVMATIPLMLSHRFEVR
jgi:hypothetical protein